MSTQLIKQSVQSGIDPIPVRAGIGLKPQHFEEILGTLPNLGWFEVHPENYMVPGGPMLDYLEKIRAHYPLSFHSIAMSLGSADGVNESHLNKLKTLIDRYQPAIVSDHLSWCRWNNYSLNDLLPVPYTTEALEIMVSNVLHIHDILGRSIAIENPSSYFNFAGADMTEAEFLVALATRSGATILLDINNVFVSAKNHGWDAREYLAQIPAHLVSEIHLAGHKVETTNSGQILIDDHGSRVCDDVWALYQQVIREIGVYPTLIEWDTDIPGLSELLCEASSAERILNNVQTNVLAS